MNRKEFLRLQTQLIFQIMRWNKACELSRMPFYIDECVVDWRERGFLGWIVESFFMSKKSVKRLRKKSLKLLQNELDTATKKAAPYFKNDLLSGLPVIIMRDNEPVISRTVSRPEFEMMFRSLN